MMAWSDEDYKAEADYIDSEAAKARETGSPRKVGEDGALRERLCERITSYLTLGGLFNAELANHDAVRELLFDCRVGLSLSSPTCPCGSTEHTPETHFAQASSEIREATEAAITAFGGCLCTCDETPHRRACNVVIATKLREALAPSRQGAGGK